jgi:cell wall-associated NlpC family hydrolase
VTAAPRRRAVPLLLAAGLTLALSGSAALLPAAALAAPTPHTASPTATSLDDAKAKARALRLQVDKLRTEAEQATEAYDAAYDELGRVVTAHLTAQRALDNAVSSAATTSGTASNRVRALYMSGGSPALYVTVLQGTDITDVLTRLQSVRRVVDSDRSASTAASKTVVDRRKAEAKLAQLAARRTVLQASVADRADKVRELLAQTDTLLGQADARVRQIADEQRRAAEAAAATRAAAELAQAQRAAALSMVPTDVPAPTEAAAKAIAEAMTHLGAPYVWGATGPESYDCSGLTLTAYRAAGIELPRTAAQQYFSGPQVALGDLAPGDLLFWGYDASNPATIHHVALYVGKGLMIAAPHTGDVVRVQPVYLDGFVGAVRPSVSL